MNASATANAFVPLTFAPGEAYQFDSHGDVWVKTDSKSLLRLFGIQGLSQICMDAARVRRRFKLTYGRRNRRLHQYPACCGDG